MPRVEEDDDDEEVPALSSATGETQTAAIASNNETDERSVCILCYERYTTNGERRPSCLQCGHIFCKGCLDRWSCNPNRNSTSTCPICNRRFRKRDIRVLYVNGLAPVDNSELVRTAEELRSCKEQLRNAEVQLTQAKYEAKVKSEMAEALSKRLAELERSALRPTSSRNFLVNAKPNVTSAVITIEQSGFPSARVMAYDANNGSMFVSCKGAPFSNTYGVMQIDLMASRRMSSAFASGAEVRDVRLDPWKNDSLMVATLDGVLRFFTTKDVAHVADIDIGEGVWSCCYNATVPHVVFAGSSAGNVTMCDLRMSGPRAVVDVVCRLNTPIISLNWYKTRAGSDVGPGLMLSSLNECRYLSSTSSRAMLTHPQPFAGNFFSLVQDEMTGHFLLSVSAASSLPCVYKFFHLSNSAHVIGCEPHYDSSVIREFHGGKLRTILNRNGLFASGHSSIAAIFNEDLHAIQLWNMSNNDCTTTIPVEGKCDKIFDICYSNDSQQKLFALSKQNLYIYQLDKVLS